MTFFHTQGEKLRQIGMYCLLFKCAMCREKKKGKHSKNESTEREEVTLCAKTSTYCVAEISAEMSTLTSYSYLVFNQRKPQRRESHQAR